MEGDLEIFQASSNGILIHAHMYALVTYYACHKVIHDQRK